MLGGALRYDLTELDGEPWGRRQEGIVPAWHGLAAGQPCWALLGLYPALMCGNNLGCSGACVASFVGHLALSWPACRCCAPPHPTPHPPAPAAHGTGLDVLSTPSGPIAAAQRAAAAAWGADATWLLVNGTTAGIHAAVLATCGPGDALVLARNAHLSALNAMVLAGCTPVWAQPSLDPDLGVAHALTPRALEAAFRQAAARGLRVRAALVVSPTYFGVLSDVAGGWVGGGRERGTSARHAAGTHQGRVACSGCMRVLARLGDFGEVSSRAVLPSGRTVRRPTFGGPLDG